MFSYAAHIEIVSPKQCGGPDGGPLARAMPAIFFIAPDPLHSGGSTAAAAYKRPMPLVQKWVGVTASIQVRQALESAFMRTVNGPAPSSISDPWGSCLLRSLGGFLSPMVGRWWGIFNGFSELTRSETPPASLFAIRAATRETWTKVICVDPPCTFQCRKKDQAICAEKISIWSAK